MSLFLFLSLVLSLASLILLQLLLLMFFVGLDFLLICESKVPRLSQHFLLECSGLSPGLCLLVRCCDYPDPLEVQLLDASKLGYSALGFYYSANVQPLVVHHDFEHAKGAEDLYILQSSFRGDDNRIALRWRLPHDLEFDVGTASIVDGQNGVPEVDVIDGYDDADESDVSDGMVEMKVKMWSWPILVPKSGAPHSNYLETPARTVTPAHRQW
jgi:hypothetical protein